MHHRITVSRGKDHLGCPRLTVAIAVRAGLVHIHRMMGVLDGVDVNEALGLGELDAVGVDDTEGVTLGVSVA